MVDLTREMADLMSALGRPQSKKGRALMFVSAYGGEGVSTVAREYARCEAAFAKKPIWLVDADLAAQGQMQALTNDPERFGQPGALSLATPDGSAFFTITPETNAQGEAVRDADYVVSRPFLGRHLWVTRFRHKNLARGQRARIAPQTTYWQALRQHAQTIIVDVPAADRSGAALQLAPLMDGVILVVSEGEGDIQARVDLKNDIEQVGGRFVGMVYNNASRIVGNATRRPLGRLAGL
ncbi:MAG: transcriptional regulator [Asticcacaulis sp.]|uniref:transcriptional regulator n=1 Tax=Asticcacaulis sp. TaxID=1872648 RepID=UPI0039E368B5